MKLSVCLKCKPFNCVEDKQETGRERQIQTEREGDERKEKEETNCTGYNKAVILLLRRKERDGFLT